MQQFKVFNVESNFMSRICPILNSPKLLSVNQDIAHARIQEFLSGGVQVSLTKKKALTMFFFLLVLSLFYRSQMVNFKEIYHFQGSRGDPTFSRGWGGVQLFPGGGGIHCSFPIETHITCDFPGGSPVSPPLDPHL